MIPHDYHVHSNFSLDCKFSMREMCEGALANGVNELGFTDHFDLHPADEGCNYFKLSPWVQELTTVREQYAGRLPIRAGIELGEPHVHQAEVAALYAAYPFDYALGSLHYVGDGNVFDVEFFNARTPAQAFNLYFEELLRLVQWGRFEILSHLDVVARTGQRFYGAYDPRLYAETIRPVLKACVERGIALDINTKGLRTPLNLLTPNLDILRWYVELGGERITLGSDAHQPKHVGAGCEVAREVVQAAGLKYLTYFEQRQARLVPFE